MFLEVGMWGKLWSNIPLALQLSTWEIGVWFKPVKSSLRLRIIRGSRNKISLQVQNTKCTSTTSLECCMAWIQHNTVQQKYHLRIQYRFQNRFLMFLGLYWCKQQSNYGEVTLINQNQVTARLSWSDLDACVWDIAIALGLIYIYLIKGTQRPVKGDIN